MIKDKRRQAQKKNLWKACYARRTVEHSIRACDFVLGTIKDEEHPLYYPMLTAICVMYSKPFTHSNTVGALSDKLKKYDERELRSMHDTIMHARNNFYAHSDPTVQRVFFRVELFNHPEGTLRKFWHGVEEVWLRGINVLVIRKMCIELEARLADEFEQLVRELYGQKHLPPGDFMLDLHNDE